MKVLAAASKGGHWIELQRVCNDIGKMSDVVYVSTNPSYAKMINGEKLYVVDDFSQWNALKMIPVFFQAIKIIKCEKPDFTISTGAAPGLMVLLASRVLGVKTIWIDSIASVTTLSLSGRLASRFASRVYTQWSGLSSDKIIYKGNVLE
ncbi:MAG: oligosaccharide biosynthesis protein Alg14 [Rikenellaceae bacterium]